MKFIATTLLFFLTTACVFAQYTTPNTGVDWTLDDIAAASPSTVTVSGNNYTLHENLTVATNDILRIDNNLTLLIEQDVRVTIFGSFFIDAEDVIITAVNQNLPYDGFRFEEFSEINIQNSIIEYGGGMQVLTETFTLNNCTVQYHVSGVTTGAAITFSRGMPIITNNTFFNNVNPAMSSGANQSVSAYVFNNHIEGNNQTNNNRPQINFGGTRPNDTLKIIQNYIIGDRDLIMAGGIAVANLAGGTVLALIEDNVIKDNRYGITVVGPNSFAVIKNNVIEDNDTQGDPMLGGSGINLNAPTGGQTIVASENQIRRNLWGVSIQGDVAANFGDDNENTGGNVFSENGNNGEIFALYNNGPATIMAKHNCWIEGEDITLAEAEEVIFHQVDDPSLGEVIFDPLCEFMSVEDIALTNFYFYPNPAVNTIYFNNTYFFAQIRILDINGKILLSQQVAQGLNEVNFQLASGIYFVQFENGKNNVVKKLIVN